MNNYITTEELAEKLKVTRQTIWLWRKNGLPHIKISRSVRFDFEAVLEWINKQNEKESE